MDFEQMKRLNIHINTKIYMIHSKLDDFIHVVATLITNDICNTFKIVIMSLGGCISSTYSQILKVSTIILVTPILCDPGPQEPNEPPLPKFLE